MTAFVILFSAVYRIFSHGVSSGYMTFAFLFPLAGIVLPCLLYERTLKKQMQKPRRTLTAILRPAGSLYRSGIMTWMMGSLFLGVLEIYGTTNYLSRVYWAAGAVLIAAAGIYVICIRHQLSYVKK